MKPIITIVSISVIFAAIVSADSPDDNPRIDPSEIVAPSIDANSPEWKPGYMLYENPETVECFNRPECIRHLENETAAR